MKFLLSLIVVLSLAGCKKDTGGSASGEQHPKVKTFLALGDSYTWGEGVVEQDSYPFQLASKLRAGGFETDIPHIIAWTGWTTVDLLAALKQEPMDEKYDFVTLLIGVNNQYVKRSKAEYRSQFTEILNLAIARSRGGRATVYVISIPDWTVTPFGKLKNVKLEAESLSEYNDINREEAKNASVNYIDITPASRIADTDETYTSIDGLHPSHKMYAEWADKIYSLVRKELN